MFKKLVSIGLSLMMMLGVTGYAPVSVQAADDGHLGSVTSVEVDADDKNIVWVTFDNGYQGKITFLDNDIFRYNVDPSGQFNTHRCITVIRTRRRSSSIRIHPMLTHILRQVFNRTETVMRSKRAM